MGNKKAMFVPGPNKIRLICNGFGSDRTIFMMKSELPRISEVIAPYIDFSKVPEYTLERAKSRGTEVHQTCAAYSLGLFHSIPSEYRGYFTSFQIWFDKYVEEVIYVEKKLEDATYGFRGTLDFYGRLKRLGMTLIDIKTPIILYKQWKVQLSAYKRLLDIDRKKVDVVAALQLDPNGGIPKMVRYEDSAQDFNIFLGILNAHHFFN